MLFLRDRKGQTIGDWLWQVVCELQFLSTSAVKEGEFPSMSREYTELQGRATPSPSATSGSGVFATSCSTFTSRAVLLGTVNVPGTITRPSSTRSLVRSARLRLRIMELKSACDMPKGAK